MSGRGRGKGRGGRGTGRSNSRRKPHQSKRNDRKKKTLSDHNYYLGNARQASDFETTTEFIINHIKKTYTDGKDIAKALYDLESADTTKWRPSLQVSLIPDTDPETTLRRDAENREFEMIFKQELSRYSSRVTQYEDNLIKSYALIWERCSAAMKNKISNRKDFRDKIYDDPIELLRAIREHALNYQEYKYSMAIVADAFRNLLQTRQKEHENLQEFAKRFRTAEEIFQSHLGGSLIIPKLVREHDNFVENDTEQNMKVVEEVYQQFLAYIFMEQSDQTKYGSLMVNLSSQHSLSNDQYPRTMSQATNVLSNHRHDETSRKRDKNRKDNEETEESDEKDQPMPLSFAQIEGKCYCCGSTKHKSPACPHKSKPKPEWWINKAQQHLQKKQDNSASKSSSSNQSATEEEETTVNEDTESVAAWMGVHLAHIQLLEQQNTSNMQEWILLDSQSSTSIFCNPKYVKDIVDIGNNEPSLEVQTNGGTFKVRQKATVEHFGSVWYYPKSITNIFSHAKMADRYRITYDNHDKARDAFIVHTSVKPIRFV